MIFVGLLIILLSIYIRSIQKSYDYFKIRGIPGPPPKFFFGHFFASDENSFSRRLEKWTKTYGAIYGIFEGTRPVFIVSDPNFLEDVYQKQFAIFHSRHMSFVVRLPNDNRVHLFAAVGERWRRQRHIINPTFSNAKLKSMSAIIQQCIERLMIKLDQQEPCCQFDIYPLYKRLTMDVICKSLTDK